MSNEYRMGCPECYMSSSLNSVLSKGDDCLMCTCNPSHRFKLDSQGFLKSI